MYIIANAVVVEAGSSVTCSRVVHAKITGGVIMKKVMTALAKMAAVFGIMAVSSWALYMEYVRGKRD